MKKGLTGVLVFLIVIAFGSKCQIFAHQMVHFDGTITISGLNEEITEEVKGVVDITQWGHDETNGNFDEAMFQFELVSEQSECGNLLDVGTATISGYRRNEYSITSEKFPLDLCEDGMAVVMERILNKHGKTVQDGLGLDECFSISDGGGITNSGKILKFANAYISNCKAIIMEDSVKVRFKIKPTLTTFDSGYQNRQDYPLEVAGKLTIHREDMHHD
ncbi:MAG: hypothetical protein DCC43_08695 [Candidatus Brocadia sp.]|uniref:Uncharacterized protein n=1 Tax=Candidatus Brocadia fulgida TaxID=380242 RepID=A0A0M2UX75_9BACT|nr:MAG: hypothetical protein BROFUL_01683 [Candidatus Brocadia fulgida]MCC6326471.1 hypothetical protein [Candidatus Brocadia sp.]MCE7911576.1 hypothetical protein [Candidatus Brocadia sp. AMX3]OQY98934.1 MAG: hypothetical protein B6D35_10810 [Candidatus Brocadia sp. UTAMX2]MDG5997457.1 hypothetical protein [Candidatus Brocadia sp.]